MISCHMKDLNSLKNFGPYMIRVMAQIGIHTVEDLLHADYLSIRDRLIEEGIQPHLNIFYSIEMGLQGRVWSTITEQEKDEIKKIINK